MNVCSMVTSSTGLHAKDTPARIASRLAQTTFRLRWYSTPDRRITSRRSFDYVKCTNKTDRGYSRSTRINQMVCNSTTARWMTNDWILIPKRSLSTSLDQSGIPNQRIVTCSFSWYTVEKCCWRCINTQAERVASASSPVYFTYSSFSTIYLRIMVIKIYGVCVFPSVWR